MWPAASRRGTLRPTPVTTDDAKGPLLGASAVAGTMIAQQVAGKVARDALFLSSFPATYLPRAVVAGALLSLLAVLATSRLMARVGPRRLVPAAFALNGVLFGVEWVLAPQFPGVVAAAIYLHTAAVGGVVISGFWSVVNERFDPHTAKLAVARITTGATLGGLVGGLAAERVGVWLDPRHILLLLAVANIGGAIGVARIAHGVDSMTRAAASFVEGFRPLSRSRYLRAVAAVVVSVALLEVFLEYALKAKAAEVHADERGLVSFFAIFYTAAAFVTFVVQVGFANKSLDKLGLGGTLALGPALVIGTSIGAALHFELWTIALATGVQSVVANSVFRSAYELLYTPVDPAVKRPIKVVIDVALGRLGSMIGSGVIIVLVAVALPVNLAVILLAAVLAATALALCLGLHRGYVSELAHSLQSGVVALDEKDVVDATTRQTLASTTMALDRDRLLAEIEALRDVTGSTGSQPAAVVEEAVRRVVDDGESERWCAAIRTIAHGSPEQIRALLEADLDPKLVPFLAPLLARSDSALVAAVSSALEARVDHIAGQLTDAFLDKEAPLQMRRRLPRILRASDDTRVADVLVRGLSDDDFDVRYFSARALGMLVERGVAIPYDESRAFAQARAELEVDDATWRRRARLRSDPPTRTGVHRALGLVFEVLGLALEHDVVRLALGALEGDDKRLRGTALEYLENVLPPDLAARLFERTAFAPQRVAQRPKHAAASDLRKSASAITFDRSELDGQG